MDKILEKYGYVALSQLEMKRSKATHQQQHMHAAGERYALTLLVDGEQWVHYDDRGDVAGSGAGQRSLDEHLAKWID